LILSASAENPANEGKQNLHWEEHHEVGRLDLDPGKTHGEGGLLENSNDLSKVSVFIKGLMG
jgi:hypothetical protein